MTTAPSSVLMIGSRMAPVSGSSSHGLIRLGSAVVTRTQMVFYDNSSRNVARSTRFINLNSTKPSNYSIIDLENGSAIERPTKCSRRMAALRLEPESTLKMPSHRYRIDKCGENPQGLSTIAVRLAHRNPQFYNELDQSTARKLG